MNCTIVKQLPNHCVPACLESVAKDSGISSITQKDIVGKVPNVFPGGVINDVNKSPNLEDVVRDLGLAEQVFRIAFPRFEKVAALCEGNEVLLMWTDEARHCVRVCGYERSSQLFTVMDPREDEVQTYDAARLNRLAPSLIYFKKRDKERNRCG